MATNLASGVVSDPKLHDYTTTGGARRYKSTAGTQIEVDIAVLDEYSEALQRDGFVVLRNLIDADTVAAMRADIKRLFATRPGGRNPFEGLKTQLLYAVVDKTLACNPLVEHPAVLGLLDWIFDPNYLLSQLQAINILPGEAAQPLHYDDGFYKVPRPRAPFGAATVIALDDFTADNGATVAIPGSHLWGAREPTEAESAAVEPVVMPAGSAVLFLGTLWHGGGENRLDRARLALTAQYCAPWCRQQENFSLSVSTDQVRRCSEHMQRLLGYSIYPPFMGMVNGMHPKRLLEA
ncbi:MAG: phytanoyl-CoA dioxygenase [Sphingomonas sanxanigenens]|uniref:Phytanoyl-CoA dioxygenase n=1 Tax=Sphingomonas sanxanigenens TaxID=397260 RepID=A0A2W5C673_9SPHN|nr:MAG: phytanoyl-CoA dioxygenase [Sphingomonas sanxanigenens]